MGDAAQDRYEDASPGQQGNFLGNRDLAFLQGTAREYVEEVVRTTVRYYRVDASAAAVNIYGESPGGREYMNPFDLPCLITPQDQSTQQGEAGFEVSQDLEIAVQREELKRMGFYPEEGDIAEWSNLYFEVSGVVDNTLLAGRYYFRHGVVISLHQTRESSLGRGAL